MEKKSYAYSVSAFLVKIQEYKNEKGVSVKYIEIYLTPIHLRTSGMGIINKMFMPEEYQKGSFHTEHKLFSYTELRNKCFYIQRELNDKNSLLYKEGFRKMKEKYPEFII